jgi:ribosomal protein S27E
MDEALRAELLRRVEEDQNARKPPDFDRMREADAENLPWLKAVVAERGWPGRSLAGVDGAHAMWLMVQHATEDLAFMRECLDLLTAAVAAGEASATDQAFLLDRVLLHEGEQQVYGTQMTRRGGQWVADNLRDPDGVDERRAAVGMGPLAERLASFTGTPAMTRIKCSDCDAWTPFEPPDTDDTVTVTCTGCGREMTVSGPPRRLPGQGMPFKCPGCGAWASFDPPAPGEPVTITCPECGNQTTATWTG